MKSFSELNLNQTLKHSIERMHFRVPTPIQVQAIPPALLGKDVLGSAQTGTGKTLCYGIACINKLLNDKSSGALIVCPTRELAVQVGDVLSDLIENKMNINSAVLIGGESIQKQLKQLKRRPRLIIGTPGRINDHLKRKSLKLNETYFLVLDETDRMLDMGFTPQIEQILKFIPKKHQTLLFSATLPQKIIRISERYLNKPIRISVGSTTTPIEKIKQEVIQVTEATKYTNLLDQLHERKGSILIFIKTKHGADKMVDRLRYDGHQCDCMHGNLRQSKRQRTLINFRSGKTRILVSTELAARGLDVPSIQHVINYHLPQVPEDFIHRIGRTARAGAEGSALTFLTPNDKQMWRDIQKLINPNIKFELDDFKKIKNFNKKKLRFKNDKRKKRFGFKSDRFNKRSDDNSFSKDTRFKNDKRKKRFGFKSDRFNKRSDDNSFSKDTRFKNDKRKKRFGFKSDRFNKRSDDNSFSKDTRFKNDKRKKRFGFKSDRFNKRSDDNSFSKDTRFKNDKRKKRFVFKSSHFDNQNKKKFKYSFKFKKHQNKKKSS